MSGLRVCTKCDCYQTVWHPSAECQFCGEWFVVYERDPHESPVGFPMNGEGGGEIRDRYGNLTRWTF